MSLKGAVGAWGRVHFYVKPLPPERARRVRSTYRRLLMHEMRQNDVVAYDLHNSPPLGGGRHTSLLCPETGGGGSD